MVHFSKFKLSGFKSFVDPVEVEIGEGLNGIVGPNGCGKSNLVEALRWVMGETSAKKIRGSGMEDVIFAGSAKRPPRSTAEVALLLDNSALDAPEPFQSSPEIQITRRIERDKGSLYKVNGKTVRARDVQMLFADTLSGANSPALVSQGKITTIINAKPHERRNVLEESAGVAGLYTRRHEAELRLRAAESNLVRLNDSLSSMRTHLGSLKRQSGQAQKYRKLSDKIRELEMLVTWSEWDHANKKHKSVLGDFTDVEQNITLMMAEVAKLAKQHEEALTIIPDLRQRDIKAHSALQAVHIELERIESDQQNTQKAFDQAQSDLAQLRSDLEDTLSSQTEVQDSLNALTDEEKDVEVKLAHMPERIKEQEERVKVLQAQLDKTERRYQEKLSVHATKQAEAKQARQELNSLEEKLQAAEHYVQNVRVEFEALQDEHAALTDLGEARQARQQLQDQLDALIDILDTLTQDKEAKRLALEENQNQISTIIGDIRIIDGEVNSTTQLLKSLESGDQNSILNEIDVTPGYEKALSRALGDLGLGASQDAQDDVYWGQASLAAQEQSRKPDQDETISLPLLHEKANAPDALTAVLAQIFVADTHEEAEAVASQLLIGQSIVTKSGALWRWDGLRIKDTAKADTSGIHIEHKNRLQLLQTQKEELVQKQEALKARVEEAEKLYMSAYEALRQSEHEKSQLEQALKDSQSALQDLEAKHSNIALRLEHAEEKVKQGQETVSIVGGDLTKAKDLQSAFDEDQQKLIEEQLASIQEDIAAQREVLNAQRSDYDGLLFQNRQDEARAERIQSEKDICTARIEKNEARIDDFNAREKALQARLSTLNVDPKAAEGKKSTLSDKLEELEASVKRSSDKLAEAENVRNESSKLLREAEHKLSGFKEKRAAQQSEITSLLETLERLKRQIQEQFQLAPVALYEKIHDLYASDLPEVSVAQSDLIRYKHEREMMGPVNLRADQEAEEVRTELETLENEANDITEAIEQLRKAIAKLNREAKEKMLLAFEQVNTHFQKLFTRLFNGGQAHLEMIESDDPLHAGLEIYAQPPGKALQSLSLLSGGEQTLTAIALIFAMFMTNPSPICVLDEIDAPLDDANVDRVCNLLEDIVKTTSTRFMVITHHRMTMARMDRLYGVTMSEKGVSRLVSVDLAMQQTMLDQLTA